MRIYCHRAYLIVLKAFKKRIQRYGLLAETLKMLVDAGYCSAEEKLAVATEQLTEQKKFIDQVYHVYNSHISEILIFHSYNILLSSTF